MSKKLILILAVVIFFSFYNSAKAEIVINEFVSDPDSGSEWIELLNTSSSEINLNGWNWTELASPGAETEHESSPKNLSGIISAGGVFVFEMSSALNNLGDSIGLYNGTNQEDRVTFGKVNNYSKNLEAPVKGKSGALISGSWKTNQDHTKGELNAVSNENTEEINDENTSNNDNNQEISDANISPKKFQKPKIQIIAPLAVNTGVPFILEGMGTGSDGEKLSRGIYYWNFGDGSSREVEVINKEKFSHTYFYTGDYKILFEHYPDSFTDVPDATDEIMIKAIEPKILISAVGNADDFFIEITNETSNDADISNWVLLSNYRIFTLPKNTILTAKKKIIISPKISGFSIEDKNSLKLMTPQREIIFNYSLAGISSYKNKNFSQNKIEKPAQENLLNFNDKNGKAITENLSALALKSDMLENEGVYSSWIIFIICLIFIGISAFAVYYIRQKGTVLEKGSDFEILDE